MEAAIYKNGLIDWSIKQKCEEGSQVIEERNNICINFSFWMVEFFNFVVFTKKICKMKNDAWDHNKLKQGVVKVVGMNLSAGQYGMVKAILIDYPLW